MTPIKVKLSLPVVEPLVALIRGLADDLRSTPALPHAAPAAEAEFSEMWAGDLLAGQTRDVDVLLALFGEEFFSDGAVYLNGDNAEAIARACSAVRLCLRERCLQAVDDEALESGDIKMAGLDDRTRQAFMCYLFLATLQELIIQQL